MHPEKAACKKKVFANIPGFRVSPKWKDLAFYGKEKGRGYENQAGGTVVTFAGQSTPKTELRSDQFLWAECCERGSLSQFG